MENINNALEALNQVNSFLLQGNKYANYEIIVGGSLSLYFNDIKLQRILNGEKVDLDLIIIPVINTITNQKSKSSSKHNLFKSLDYKFKLSKDMSSFYGCDFDKQYIIHGVKVDVKYLPSHKKVNTISVSDISNKLVDPITVLSYKTKYAALGDKKHINDINELLLNSYVPSNKSKTIQYALLDKDTSFFVEKNDEIYLFQYQADGEAIAKFLDIKNYLTVPVRL